MSVEKEIDVQLFGCLFELEDFVYDKIKEKDFDKFYSLFRKLNLCMRFKQLDYNKFEWDIARKNGWLCKKDYNEIEELKEFNWEEDSKSFRNNKKS